MRKRQEIKRLLLKAYKENYKKNPKEYKGACKISRQIGLTPEETDPPSYWPIHSILKELEKEDCLEQKKGSGFRYKP